ncbi:TRAP transporter substrate-binding protein, partial [Escherichia coli]|nr:TRAP transporter substrate-binding protein [Escherichia coli]
SRDVTNWRGRVKTGADVKGLKIRSKNRGMNTGGFKVFGGNRIRMPFAEAYTGLESGTTEAQEDPINVVCSAKLYEVEK